MRWSRTERLQREPGGRRRPGYFLSSAVQLKTSVSGWMFCSSTLRRSKKRSPRTLPVTVSPAADPFLPLAPAWAESIWLEPYPDSWLAEATEDPAAHYSRRESVSLAFLTVLQLLPPCQRAILLLSDVLDWRASEIASGLQIADVTTFLDPSLLTHFGFPQELPR